MKQTIDRYELRQEIGRGGMATVYLAYDPRFQRLVALKLLPRELLHNTDFRTRFSREAQVIASLEHPAVVPVYDFGEEEGQPFLVMRYMPGGSLADRLAGGALSLAEGVALVNRLAPALDTVHRRGIVHRDLKPDNILFDGEGMPYVSDFGIAKMTEGTQTGLTATGRLIGTPAYMSPEQIKGVETLDGRSDIYALGVILFQMLTGRLPYHADTPMGLALQHLQTPIPDVREHAAALPAGCQAVINRAMAKEREERYPTAQAMANALAAVPASGPAAVPTDAPTVVERPATPAEAVAGPAVKEAALPTPPPKEGKKRLSPAMLAALVGVAVLVPCCLVGLLLFSPVVSALLNPPEVVEVTRRPVEEAVPVEEPAEEVPAEEVVEEEEAPPEEAENGGNRPEPEPPAVSFPVLPGGALAQALNGDFAGATVTLWGPDFSSRAPEFYALSLAEFEEATGITVEYTSQEDFEDMLSVAVAAGEPPDVAEMTSLFQIREFAEAGLVVDPATFMPPEWLEQQYEASLIDTTRLNGGAQLVAVWHRFVPLSLVWYVPDELERQGLTVPENWDQLLESSYFLAEEGTTPWCIGIETGTATGWMATNWTEDFLLRTAPLAFYDEWATGREPFSSPEVEGAIQRWSGAWLDDALVYGGTEAILSVNFLDAPLPLFDDPAGCLFHQQAAFITTVFPEGAELGADYDYFLLPPVDPAYGQPTRISGNLMVMFADRPEVRAVMEYFTTHESVRGWMENGGGIVAAQQTARPGMYADAADRRLAEEAARATAFRYDASDNMPAQVGAGAFWSGMVAYISGEQDLETVLAEMDAAWP